MDKPPKPYAGSDASEAEMAAKAIHQCSGRQRTAAQTALQFVVSNPAVASAVVGLRTPEQLEEAIAATQAPLLNSNELMHLDRSVDRRFYKEHR